MSVLPDSQIKQALVEEAARRYLDGEIVQVLSPCNRSGPLSVSKLNDAIRNLVNPASPAKKELSTKSMVFRSGDRVMITQNDRDRDCSNGDVGTLLIANNTEEDMNYSVLLPDGRHPVWCCSNGLEDMTLAYAMTVHKAQGSEVNSILMPLSFDLQTMMNRNLFYTAISRARAEVHLFGNYNTLEIAMQRRPRKRKSMLVTKTRMVMLKTVS